MGAVLDQGNATAGTNRAHCARSWEHDGRDTKASLDQDSGVALAYSGTLADFIGERMYAGPRFGFAMMTIFGCIGLLLW